MLKFHFYQLPILATSFFLFSCSDESKETNIDAIISKMTLEEKVGQMTNLTLSTIAKEEQSEAVIDMQKLRDAVVKHHIGSFQNVVTHGYTIDNWHKILQQIQDVSLKETRLKLPSLYCIDAVDGANYSLGSTLFPHNLNLAATRNPSLVSQCANITAKEVRASGIRYDFSPVLDVGRQPLWPRFGETFGEDVFLATQMGLASVEGYEGKNIGSIESVACCMKHYLGYSVPDNGKDRAAAYIPEIVLREYFLPTFKAAVDAGAHTLMVNSAEVNGTPLHASKYLLTDVLRHELGFKGVIISDWEDVKKLHERHRVADTYKEAVRLSVDAGIDLCIVPFDFQFSDYLIELVKEGKISEERIDQSVKRILQLKKDLGLFDQPYVEKESIKNFGLPEYKKVALDASRESIVLLKNNNNALPLKKDQKVFVIGPGASSLTTLNGAWSYTWQGTDAKYFSKDESTVAGAIKNKTGESNFLYQSDYKFSGAEVNTEHLQKIALEANAIVLCLGEDAYAETPGNIEDLTLDRFQTGLAKEVLSAGKKKGIPVILVLTEGRPRIISEIEPGMDAILFAGWPGSQGANAIADVLFGDYNPDGKLPFTYPRNHGCIMTYDHKLLDEGEEQVDSGYKYMFAFRPQWEFGYGLSYTNFEYTDLKLSSDKMSKEGLKISVKVKNSGSIPGKESVELYTRDLYASITPSVKRLRNFQKIYLKPGESKTLDFTLSPQDLKFVRQDLKWITEPGEFEVMIGGLKAKFVYVE